MGLVDIPYYQRLVRAATGPVLELGAGTGRLTLPLARVGATVCAVERDPAMAAQLRRRLDDESEQVRARVEVIEAEMCSLRLPTRFMLVIVPANTWLLFPTAAERAQVLAVIHAHLHPQGRAVLDIFNATPDERVLDRWIEDGHAALDAGTNVSRLVRLRRIGQPELQQLELTSRYEVDSPRGSLRWEQTQPLAFLTPAQGRAECQAAGFEVRHIHGDYTGRTEVGPHSPRQLYQLRLPIGERTAALRSRPKEDR